jgi:hypothetical protein
MFFGRVFGQQILGGWVQRGLIPNCVRNCVELNKRDLIMAKNFLLVVALVSLALTVGCAKGGDGIGPAPISIAITTPLGTSPQAIYPGQSVTLTATVTPAATNPAVTWSLSGGTSCTGSACGTLTPVTPAPDPATAIYVAPGCVSQTTCLSGAAPVVTATLVANTSITGTLPLNLVDVTTQVAPLAPNVGTGLQQQFTATALPDAAPQTFVWSCTVNGVPPCKNFVQDPNISGVAYYTAQDDCSGTCIEISAITPLDPAGCQTAKSCTIGQATLVTSRVNGTYAFRFSGYDGSNNATAVVGTFTASNGTITSGTEEELTSAGWKQHTISGGSYTPLTASNPISNNAGSLALSLPAGVYPNKYQVALDSAGDVAMIESDSQGSGSGVAQISAGPGPFKNYQVYAFGFTGVDSSFKRVGYVGLLPMDGSGNIAGGVMDVNDNGQSSNSVCNAPPCAIAGKYTSNGNGSYNITLTAPVAMSFDFYIASGSSSKTTPLTFYAISTDPGTNPAVSGTMVLQDSSQTYNNAAFNGTSVSALTGTGGTNGANTNVSLTLGVTDGTSSGKGGTGNFVGDFDQNNAGTVLTVPIVNSDGTCNPQSCQFSYTYVATAVGGAPGRYIFQMLGDPTQKTPVPPIPFVLYASGQNRGFLLDQSSPSVMTGTMSPQGKGSGLFAASGMPGTYGGATTSSGSAAVTPIAFNLLLTSPGGQVFNVNGTQYPGPVPVAETYTMNLGGNGVMAPIAPATTPNYAIYAIDTVGCTKQSGLICTVQDFMMIDEDITPPNPNPSIIFVKQ